MGSKGSFFGLGHSDRANGRPAGQMILPLRIATTPIGNESVRPPRYLRSP